jgi:L-serine/L-threonine ammonia-lyase
MKMHMEVLHSRTPLWQSGVMSGIVGAPVVLKMEALQPVGSFKIRGMGAACQEAKRQGAGQLVSSSGGNAGYAVAYAGRMLGLPVTIVVPRSTSARSRALICGEGASVIEHGEAWDDSHAHATGLLGRLDGAYIHPFDEPLAWAGHATMIHEAAEQGVKPGVVVVSVGGGGLLCGVAQGMKDVGWGDVPLMAVETRGADSFAASVRAGRLVTLEAITSLATTLGARTVAPEALAWARRREIVPWVVSDRSAVYACNRFADDHRLLVEPACGASLSAVYERAEALDGRGPILVIVCGGAGVTRELLERWTRRTDAGAAPADSHFGSRMK